MTGEGATSGRKRQRIALFLFIYAVLLFHISGYVGNTMANATLSATMAIVETGSPAVDAYVSGGRELAWYDGHFYSGMPPGQAFLAIPLYALSRPVLGAISDVIAPHVADLPMAERYDLDRDAYIRRLLLLLFFTVLLSMPAAAATCVMVADIARHERMRVGLSGILLLPLATMWWAFGTEYGPRIMCSFLLMLPVWWMLLHDKDASQRIRYIAPAVFGVGLALAPLIRYEVVFASAVLGVWLLARLGWRRGVVLVIAGLIVGGLGAAYHKHCYGGYTKTAYSRKLWTPGLLERDGFEVVGERIRVDGEEFVVYNQTRMLELRYETIAEAFWGKPRALLRISPFLILAPLGLVLIFMRHRLLAWPLVGLLAANLLALALLPHAGTRGAMGPRYLLWSLPALVLLVLPVWERLPRFARWTLFAISFAPSYLAAMLTSHTAHAWSFWQIGEFGLTNYTLSRMQEAGLIGTPVLPTAIVLVFWMAVFFVFLRLGARWALCGAEIGFEQPTDETSQESA